LHVVNLAAWISRYSRFLRIEDDEVTRTLAQLTTQIKKLQREAAAIKAKELDAVIARVKQAIERYGLTATDLGLTMSPVKKAGIASKTTGKKGRLPKAPSKAAGVVRYRSVDGGRTWTGHGRAPGWFKEALEAGATRESLEVK
jgi:DNA-binding protein H-NS